MARMYRRTRRHPEAPPAGTKDSTPKPIKDMTEDERRAFFADMRARTAAKLREMTQPAAGPGKKRLPPTEKGFPAGSMPRRLRTIEPTTPQGHDDRRGIPPKAPGSMNKPAPDNPGTAALCRSIAHA